MTRGLDLQTVIREGKRIRTLYLDVRVHASPLDVPRIGIVVPRHQQSAVARNRVKRRLRELGRSELLPALRERPALDVVIRAKREAYSATFDALRVDVKAVRERVTGSEATA